MDVVKFYCPSCGQKLSVEPDMFGTRLQCPVCNAWMKAPNGPAAATGNSPAPAPAGAASGSRRMLAVGIGAGIGLLLVAGGLALAWRSGILSGSASAPDTTDLPEWTPQAAPPPSKPARASTPTPAEAPRHPAPAAERTGTPPPREVPQPVARPDEVRIPEPPVPKPPQVPEPAAGAIEPAKQPERVLVESERRKIFALLLAADDKAQQEARKRIPDDPAHGMQVGDSLKLTEKTPLYRAAPKPDAPRTELEEAGGLTPGIVIKVAEVRAGRDTPWYRVEAVDKSGEVTGTGWVGAAWLTGQSKEDLDARHRQQQRLQGELLNQYHRAIAEEHGLSSIQVRRILSEGYENSWDGARRGDITGD